LPGTLEVGDNGTVVAAAAWMLGRAGSVVVMDWAEATARRVAAIAAIEVHIAATDVLDTDYGRRTEERTKLGATKKPKVGQEESS
jgi:hypothetical protein